MAGPEGAESGSNPSLFSSLRAFWGVVVSILATRLDLLTAELEEEGQRAYELVLVSLAAVLSIAMTVFFILFFLVVVFWDNRQLVLGIVCGVSIVLSVVMALIVRHMVQNRPKFLSQTLIEIHRDVESLRSSVNKSEEKKP